MIKILIGTETTSIDVGSKEYRPMEFTVDGIRAMRAIEKVCENTTEFEDDREAVRMDQAIMIGTWIQWMMTELREIEKELPRKKRLDAVRIADEFLQKFMGGI